MASSETSDSINTGAVHLKSPAIELANGELIVIISENTARLIINRSGFCEQGSVSDVWNLFEGEEIIWGKRSTGMHKTCNFYVSVSSSNSPVQRCI